MTDPFVVEVRYGWQWPPWPTIIIPWPSGVIFEVRCGCMAADRRQLEGFYLPIYGRYDLTLPKRLRELYPGCWDEPLSASSADRLDALFAELQIPLKVIRAQLAESIEAWVHVEVINSDQDHILRNYEGSAGVLVWQN
jgi:hypothetical protein